MRRAVYCIVCGTIWSHSLHAQDQAQNPSPNETHSALPWLSLDTLSATRERPLFDPDRRKPAPPPPPVVALPSPAEAVTQAQAQQKPQLELTGIVINPTETLVLLRNALTSESVAIHPGDSVGRWRVFVDTNYTVMLKDGAEEFRLEMFAGPDSRLRALP